MVRRGGGRNEGRIEEGLFKRGLGNKGRERSASG